MVPPGNHETAHLFEDLGICWETLRKLTSPKKRNALPILEKSLPFLGRWNGLDLSKKSGGRLLNRQERPALPLTMPVISGRLSISNWN
jgi:hypothetical protein